ncbi:MAG: zinc metallopeptidase [Verrucomicrobiaceae bacterium]|nr:zinc metallopeptidase [Verrucomicrobiaceae bacterium]
MIWIIFIGTMLLSGLASLMVRSAYSRYSQLGSSTGISGAEAAARILRRSGITDVMIESQPGTLSDHYDPTNRRLVLSDENYHGTSVAAIGVAAHEAGHALQHQAAYAPLQLRMAAVGITTAAGFVIPIVGLAGSFILSPKIALLIMAVGMGIIMLFQLITLPVEFDATARAKRLVAEMGLVAPGEETEGMNKVLNAAALTYVAAFIGALAQFLYYAVQVMGRRE